MTDDKPNNQLTAQEQKAQIAKRREKLVAALSKNETYGREAVIEKGDQQLLKMREEAGGKTEDRLTQQDPAFQLTTLFEFENGNLLVNGFGQAYRTLALELSIQFQKEYHCETESEKATAHLAAQNYVRTLELQKDTSQILNAEEYSDLRLKRYQIMSKAYDQANRQYLMSIQMLQTMKQPPINVNIRAQTANIANQQLIKQDNYEA